MAVGTSTGQVLLYGLRASHPLLVKDHYYGLPIKSCQLSGPPRPGSQTPRSSSSGTKTRGKCSPPLSPRLTSMMCASTLILALGPAPRWCSFLDNLTEELKESPESTIYDDYKFVTRKDLENLGEREVEVCLTSWDLLRAYMHCFFMDIRLYHKVKTMANPFAYDEYRKDKICQKIGVQDAESTNQVLLRPKVNKELPLKLMEERDNEEELSARKKGKSEQQQRRQQAERDHHEERKTLRRSAGHLSSERVQTD